MFAFAAPTLLAARAFNVNSLRSSNVSTRCSTSMSIADPSPSMPFMPKPKNLDDSMPGYVGFDPMGLAALPYGAKWMQESEVKHGRVAMLSIVGMIAQEFIQLPGGDAFSEKLATSALTTAPTQGLWQIFLFCGLVEWFLHKGKITPFDMHDDGKEPGTLGFNPLNFPITPKSRLQEIKNGRLAMIASGGFIHQMLLTKTPVIEQLTHFKAVVGS